MGDAPAVIVLAYGNPLRGDDSLGWHACEELSRVEESIEFAGKVRIVCSHQLGPEVVEDLKTAKRVIFIDATANPGPAYFARRELNDAKATEQPTAFSHHLPPEELLWLCRHLNGTAPNIRDGRLISF